MSARPFTVARLAERWECSEGAIRRRIVAGELRTFRIGALIRIPASEVERIECQNTQSSASMEDMPSSGESPMEIEAGDVFPPPIASGRKPRPASAGVSATVLNGPWAG